VEALRAAVRHHRGLVADRKVAQQRLHDQLNALCPDCRRPGSWRKAQRRTVTAFLAMTLDGAT
jgi:hypothetical protein